MKIAFIGTHGVGKTTLCYELAAALKRLDLSVDLVKEVARVVGGGGGGRPQLATAGGKEPEKIPQALKHGRDVLERMLAGS